MNEKQLPPASPSQKLHTRQRLLKWISVILTVCGVAFISWGGWIYYQQYTEALKPPPAPIIQMSLAELELTLTPQPNPTTVQPTATPKPATPTKTNTTVSPVSNTQATVAPTDTAVPTPAEPEAADDTLSLANNPLLVVSEETEPDNAESAATPPPAILAETAPQLNAIQPTGLPLTHISADSIQLDADVIPVGWETITQNGKQVNVWRVADYAAGWHSNSLLPGQGGNVVLSGHHNIKGEVFRYIVDLNLGDVLTLTDEAGNQFNYAVADKFIVKDKGEPDAVRRANARWIGPFNDERLTLVTCWPYNNNTHRVIVIAKPVPQP
ncbi:MAG: sortase [Chloroflexi bacterium]|nr:MAG: sortase [Chloroflexota bacterium]